MTRRRTSAPYASLTLDVFRGLVQSRPAALLEPGEAQVAENVDLRDGFIRRRSGWTDTGTMVAGLTDKSVRGVFGRYTGGSATELIAVAHDSLIALSGSAWTTKDTFGFTPPINPTFAQSNDAVYIASEANGVAKALQKYNGTDVTPVASGPTARIVLFFNNALWVAGGDGADAERVKWSRQLPNHETWPANNYVDLTKGEGDSVTGLAPLQGQLFALKQRSIARIQGYPPDDAATVTGSLQTQTYIMRKPGCIAPRTVASSTNLIVYLNREGVYGFDGFEARNLTKDIRPIFDFVNESELKNAVGGFIEDDHYVLSVATSHSSVPNLVISIRFAPGGGTVDHITTWRGYPKTDLGDGQSSHNLNIYSIGTYTFGGKTHPVLGLLGKVGKMDDAATDNTERIRWDYVTGILPMGETGGQKVIRRGWVAVAPGSGVLELTFLPDFATENIDAIGLDPSTVTTTGEKAVTLRFPMVGAARRWAARVGGEGDGPRPEIHSLALEYFARYRG